MRTNSASWRSSLLAATLWWLRRRRIRSGQRAERIKDWPPSSSCRASTSNNSRASKATTARLTTARNGSRFTSPAACSRASTGNSRNQRQKGSSRGKSIQRRKQASRQLKPGRRRRNRRSRNKISKAKTL